LESTNIAHLFEILVTYFPFHSKKKKDRNERRQKTQ